MDTDMEQSIFQDLINYWFGEDMLAVLEHNGINYETALTVTGQVVDKVMKGHPYDLAKYAIVMQYYDYFTLHAESLMDLEDVQDEFIELKSKEGKVQFGEALTDGELTGLGREHLADGTVRYGVFKGGELEPIGIEMTPEGDGYTGGFQKGQKKGWGMMKTREQQDV